MNQQLQILLDFIQQNETISAEEKEVLIKAAKKVKSDLEISEFKLERTEKVKRTTAILLEETIEELEQKRKSVEAQNRELEIEAALERIRTVAMSMNKTDDVLSICKVMFTELKSLGFDELRNALINFFDDEHNVLLDYDYADFSGGNVTHIPYSSHPTFEDFQKRIRSATDAFAELIVSEDELESWKERRRESGEYEDARLENITVLYYYFYSIGVGAVGISTFSSLPEEKLQLIKRFRNVFELAYRRYTDIEKAEAQAREAKIEAALESVRSFSLAMHKSDELQEVVKAVFERLKSLDIDMNVASIFIFKAGKKDWEQWVASSDTNYTTHFHLPYTDNIIFRDLEAAKQTGKDFYAAVYSFKQKNDWFNYAFTKTAYSRIPEERKKFLLGSEFYKISFALAKNTGLQIAKYSGENFSENDNDVLRRFSKVFEQAYIRFLDLQKAEAQTRESQIELALERVRARTMAMQHSIELAETSSILFQQIKELGFETWSCGFCIWKENDLTEVWMGADSGGLLPPMYIPYKKEPTHHDVYKAHLKKVQSYHKIWEGKDLEEHYTFLKTIPSVKEAIDMLERSGLSLPERQCYYVGFFKQGYLLLITKDPNTELKDLSSRFAKVFDQTYTRFLDLQKAEAQAKESQIQLALERVRARTMAMQRSDELQEAASLMFQQIEFLGAPTWNCSFNIWTEDKKYAVAWNATKEGFGRHFYSSSSEDVFLEFYTAAQQGKELFIKEIGGQELVQHYQYLSAVPGVGETIAELKAAGIALPTFQIFNIAYFTQGYLMFITYKPVPELWDIFKRFAKVFEQTYTRFLDLQKAEAQAREAQIQLALERIRARTMAMQSSHELAEAASLLFQQVKSLGIETFSSGYIIWGNDGKDLVSWMCNADGSMNPPFIMPVAEDQWHIQQYQSWKEGGDFIVNDMSGERMKAYFRYLRSFPLLDEAFKISEGTGHPMPERQVHNAANFSHGNLLFITYEPMPEAHDIFKRFANVFEQTYTRFLDLQKAEAQTRESEIELALERVRARTMAMQNSEELSDVSFLLDTQVRLLGIKTQGCAFNIYGPEESTEWFSNEIGTMPPYKTPMKDLFLRYYNAGKNGELIHIEKFDGEACVAHYEYLCTLPGMGDGLKAMIKAGGSFPKRQTDHVVYFKYGYLLFLTLEDVPEAHDIFIRFAKVFEQTYTRFLDLQKAEAQTLRAEQNLVEIKAARKKAEETLVELQSAQKQLIQSEKMASLGELTAGIAHEIQNPLNFVNNFSEVSTELVEEMIGELSKANYEEAHAIADDLKQNLDKINHHGRRAGDIVKGMLQHSRTSNGSKEPTDNNVLADEYLRLAYHGLRAKDKSFNATLQTDFDDTIGKINIIPQDMGRVILNLITNAFYAVGEKKKQLGNDYEPIVTVSTNRSLSIGEGRGEVQVKVADNGSGIPSSIKDKVFQPFFTTKPTGQGTGLGLSLAYDIVKAHGGEITIESNEGEGSTFTIQLLNS